MIIETPLPPFVHYSEGKFTIRPISGITKVGNYSIELSLSDGIASTSYKFNIEVIEITYSIILSIPSILNKISTFKNISIQIIIASIKIIQVKNDGRARLAINAETGGNLIVDAITNQSLSLSVNGN